LKFNQFSSEVPHAGNMDPENVEDHGPNCLTITHGSFCNKPHLDRDYSRAVYGWWWAARKGEDGYEQDPGVDHDRIVDGQFVWPEFGIGVDFAKYVQFVFQFTVNTFF
jgi:hypothetical protein